MGKHWEVYWYADGLVQKGRLVCGNVPSRSSSGHSRVWDIARWVSGSQGQEGKRRWEMGSGEHQPCASGAPRQTGWWPHWGKGIRCTHKSCSYARLLGAQSERPVWEGKKWHWAQVSGWRSDGEEQFKASLWRNQQGRKVLCSLVVGNRRMFWTIAHISRRRSLDS